MAVREAILKVASRCNINCTYCYEFNLADQSWKGAPKLMSTEVIERAFVCMRDHAVSHDLHNFSIVLHGGEPMLLGADRLDAVGHMRDRIFSGTGVRADIGIQSNGLLFSDAIGDVLRKHSMSLGISIDGPPEINDRARVDHQGRGTGKALEDILHRLSAEFRDIFAGFLVVIDVDVDPIVVFDYLTTFRPSGVDVILPHDNHSRRPKGKMFPNATPYGAWLIRLFDHWWRHGHGVRVRLLESIVRLVLGGRASVDGIGTESAGIVVVHADGSWHGNDALKGTFEGATRLGLNVFEHSLDDVLKCSRWPTYAGGFDTLPDVCRGCDYVRVCGGGYLTSRWSATRGFDNPSVYCPDLQRLIDHVASVVLESLAGSSKSVTLGAP